MLLADIVSEVTNWNWKFEEVGCSWESVSSVKLWNKLPALAVEASSVRSISDRMPEVLKLCFSSNTTASYKLQKYNNSRNVGKWKRKGERTDWLHRISFTIFVIVLDLYELPLALIKHNYSRCKPHSVAVCSLQSLVVVILLWFVELVECERLSSTERFQTAARLRFHIVPTTVLCKLYLEYCTLNVSTSKSSIKFKVIWHKLIIHMCLWS